MNLLIIGHQGHGKTDVGQKLAELLKTTAHDSSWFMCERVIYPALKDKYNYESAAECHSDRGYHRQEWFELIEAYNSEPDRLTRAILAEEYDLRRHALPHGVRRLQAPLRRGDLGRRVRTHSG